MDLTVTDRTGLPHTLSGATGGTLMQAISDAGLEDVFGICGGACSCASCHVIVDPAWFAVVGARSGDEDDLLEGSEFIAPTSRLSCQIKLTDALNGLRVIIAPEG